MDNLKPTKSWLSFDNELVLRKNCEIVNIDNITNEDLELMKKMISYVDATFEGNAKKYKIVPGIAIAANQLGVSKQIIYIHFIGDGIEHKYMLMNPKIISMSLQKTYIPVGEGCLSVNEEHKGCSIRYKKIKIKAYDFFNKKNIEINANGFLSICLQHEIDHLNGKLFYDRISDNLNDAIPYEEQK